MNRTGTLAWTATLNPEPDTVVSIAIVWLESIDDEDLILTGNTEDLRLRADGTIEQFNNSGFSINFDFDDDGVVNFQERVNGTNPFMDETANPVIALRTNDNLFDAGNSTVLPGVADVIVPRISEINAPVIDGRSLSEGANRQPSGEWAAAVQNDISGAPLSIANLMIDVNAEAIGPTPLRRWAAMHDGRYLYVLVTVEDNGQRQRDSGISLEDDDSLELFLDADNSKSLSYDDNDFHRIIPRRQTGVDASTVGATSGGYRWFKFLYSTSGY